MLIHVVTKIGDVTSQELVMNFCRPFRAELVNTKEIWIVDAEGAFVTRFPRTSDDITTDLKKAEIVAKSDKGEDF